MKKWHIPFLVALITATIIIARQERAGQWQRDEGMAFGTVYHATYRCDSSLNSLIARRLAEVDASLSMFNPLSTISRINGGEGITDSLFRVVYAKSREVSRATAGAFDITVAPLVNAWGFGYRTGELPDSAAVDSIMQFVGWRRVALNGDTLIKQDPRTVLDCSAVAKGFGADRVAQLLDSMGIADYLVEIGGELVARGVNPKGKPWSIGINKPVDDSASVSRELQTVVHMTDVAMATSGNYRNYYTTAQGQRVAHTIDPRTGHPVQRDILSSTVTAPDCATADAYATAFMVMGLDSARAVLRRHPELGAYFIYQDHDGKHRTWTAGCMKR